VGCLVLNCKYWFVFGTFVYHRRAWTSGEDCFKIRGVAASKLGSQTDLHGWVYRDHGVCRVSAGVIVHVGYCFLELSFLVYYRYDTKHVRVL